jgi:hypothetical protein
MHGKGRVVSDGLSGYDNDDDNKAIITTTTTHYWQSAEKERVLNI